MAEAGQRGVAQGGDGVGVGHVEGTAQSGRRQRRREGGAGVGVEVGDNDVGPVGGQRRAVLAADQPQRAGDDGRLVVEGEEVVGHYAYLGKGLGARD